MTYRLATLPVLLRGVSSDALPDPTVIDDYTGSLNPLIDLTDAALLSAHKARDCVRNNLNATGWLQNVVDPESFDDLGSVSAEAESFVLLMEAAWRDWIAYAEQG